MMPQSSLRSTNLQRIDRLIDALGGDSVHSSFSSQGLLASSITSSLQSAMLNFGIVDSMTLHNEDLRRSRTHMDGDRDTLDDTHAAVQVVQDDQDAVHSTGSDHHRGRVSGPVRQRSGKRRGYQQQHQQQEVRTLQEPQIIKVLTKFNDGPSPVICIPTFRDEPSELRYSRAA